MPTTPDPETFKQWYKERVKSYLAQTKSAPELYSRLLNDRWYATVPFRDALMIARDEGKISAGMDVAIMEVMRVTRERLDEIGKIGLSDPFIPNVRALVNEEPTDYDDMLARYDGIASKVRVLRAATTDPSVISNDPDVLEYNAIRSRLHQIMSVAPASLLLHFYDNGDLKWMWGMSEMDTDRDIGTRTGGGRFGTSSGAAGHDNW